MNHSMLADFESAWRNQEVPPDLEHYAITDVNLLTELIQVDLRFRLEAGERIEIADYMRRFPGLSIERHPLYVATLLHYEFLAREALGQTPNFDSLLSQYPQVAEQLREFRSQIEADTTIPDPFATKATTKNEFRAGQKIGRYTILDELGVGGMGKVYIAEQEKPLRRRVALKVVKPGMDSTEILKRFDAEKQALAMMEHRNIARVLDAGVADSGQSFFAMELVKGVHITTYCDSNRLALKDRLSLFVQTCEAIAHAHQKGIIHRDIKPANVLVAVIDDLPVVKVIDFGLAKALRPETRLSDGTVYTSYGQVMGTFQYMSPEQTGKGNLDIDTRSDVYALGVLLYELLTGCTPIDDSQVKDLSEEDLLHIIQEEDPARPSRKLSSLGQKATEIAKRRGVPRGELVRSLSGELDWIVIKALEKDRTRRYATVNSLAEDIVHFLNNDVVSARPPSISYRLVKTFNRYRTVFLTTAAFCLILCVATVVSIIFAVDASRSATKAKKLADDNAKLAEGERQQRITAEAREQELIEQDRELANALIIGFAGLEAHYTQSDDPIRAILRTEEKSKRQPVTAGQVRARRYVLDALTPISELLTSELKGAAQLRAPLTMINNAERNLTRAIAADPDLGVAYLARAELWSRVLPKLKSSKNPFKIFLRAPEPTRVTSDWHKAVELLPDSGLAYSGRGHWIYERDPKAGIADLEMSLKKSPNNDLAAMRLARHYAESGQKSEQIDDYRMALKYYRRAFETKKRLGSLFFGSSYDQGVLSGVVNASIAIINRSKNRDEAIFAAALLNVASSNNNLVDQKTHMQIWQMVAAELTANRKVETLPTCLLECGGLDGSNQFQLTRMAMLGFTKLAVGIEPTVDERSRMIQLGKNTTTELNPQFVEGVIKVILSRRPQTEHSQIRQFQQFLNDHQWLVQ